MEQMGCGAIHVCLSPVLHLLLTSNDIYIVTLDDSDILTDIPEEPNPPWAFKGFYLDLEITLVWFSFT